MRTKKRIHPYVTPELAKRLESYCAAKGITSSAVVQSAVDERLSGAPKDLDLIMRRLDRLGRASVTQQRDLSVLTESFAFFVRMWFAYQPPMPEADKPASEHLSHKRYNYLVDFVSRQLAGGRGLTADIAQSLSAAPDDAPAAQQAAGDGQQ